MAGKSGGITVLILVIAAFAAAGCSSELGSVGEGLVASNTSYTLDVEFQKTYNKGESFQPGDLDVFLVNNNNEKQRVPDGAYQVYVIENPDGDGALSPLVTSTYTFESEGKKIILVKYLNYSFDCAIVVLPTESKDGQTSGIEIVWVV